MIQCVILYGVSGRNEMGFKFYWNKLVEMAVQEVL